MNFIVANDNGNSEQKISINGEFYRQPNVYQTYYNQPVEEQPLNAVMQNLLETIIVTIDSKAVANIPSTYVIGKRALEVSNSVRNMDIKRSKKHKEVIPLINTLGFLAAYATKKRYEEQKGLENGEVIEVDVAMTTALPASVHNEFTKNEFASNFMNHYHEVKVHFNNTHTIVKVKFNDVKVVAEGVPALFNIIEDGKGNYRDDDLFEEFKETYDKDSLDGSYFADKRLLHVDIGDGTTELTFTQGYKHDSGKSTGLDFGLGVALESALIPFQNEMEKYDLKVKRQDLSTYLQDENSNFHDLAVSCIKQNLEQLVQDLERAIKDRTSELKLEFDVIAVYGGASIILKEELYPRLVEHFKPINKEVLWIPAKYAVDMNVLGMQIFNDLTHSKSVK
jgi:plasmid segregation protein ParM